MVRLCTRLSVWRIVSGPRKVSWEVMWLVMIIWKMEVGLVK